MDLTKMTPVQLVEELVRDEFRFDAYMRLCSLGAAALPATIDGLRHPNWQVRRWCAMYMDEHADDEALHALVPLLEDSKAIVRLWALHSVSCEHCKDDQCPIDVTPLLLDRLERDDSIRVRRMAAAMIAFRPPDRRAVPHLRSVEKTTDDRKLRFHCGHALQRLAEIG